MGGECKARETQKLIVNLRKNNVDHFSFGAMMKFVSETEPQNMPGYLVQFLETQTLASYISYFPDFY